LSELGGGVVAELDEDASASGLDAGEDLVGDRVGDPAGCGVDRAVLEVRGVFDRGPVGQRHALVGGAVRAQLDPVGSEEELGSELLVVPVVDQSAVVKVRPVLDERIAGLDRTLQQGGGGALEVGFAVAVKCDAPSGSGGGRSDEAVAGPVVFGQDATQHLGVGVVGVTAPAELDGIELVAHALGSARSRLRGAGDQLAGEVRPLRFAGRHAPLRLSGAA
jgi:hypothetical protein